MIPSLRYQPRIDSIVSWTDRMKQAEHCGCGSMPTLNHTGLLNDAFCSSEQVRQLVGERLRVGRRGEVALRLAPAADRPHDAADHLPDAVLALGAAERAAEVLRHDDVGRQLRPRRRNLDVVLLEDDLALLVLDDRAAPLPLRRRRTGAGPGW